MSRLSDPEKPWDGCHEHRMIPSRPCCAGRPASACGVIYSCRTTVERVKRSFLAFVGATLMLCGSAAPVRALPRAGVTDNKALINFPESATFSATISSPARIASVVLEYGSRQLTCGDVVAKAFPPFDPAVSVHVEWTWDMRQSGSLPPGAQLWWRWRYTDEAGNEFLSNEHETIWIDDVHRWRTDQAGPSVRIHSYNTEPELLASLSQAAATGLEYSAEHAGLEPQAPIDIYVYDGVSDMRDAILYEAAWTGGQAFPEQDIVILGISASDEEWGGRAIVHELTHVLVGHLTFTCLGVVPTWLNEGLAVYSEGGLDPASRLQLDESIANDNLLPIRTLSGGFSEVTSRAALSYSESFSVVDFLIERHGQEKMQRLLLALRDGNSIDDALTEVYGFDVDGLEDEWRTAIGARPRRPAAQATARPSPTQVPTIQPITSSSLATPRTPAAATTPALATGESEPNSRLRPPVELTIALGALCCVFLFLIGVVVLGVFLRRNSGQGAR